MNDVIGLLNCHDSPELGDLTSQRPLASTLFLGRYAFCDFTLSNFINGQIPEMGIMIRNHQRSMLKHLGSMNAWVTNTKIGSLNVLYNEKGQLNPLYNTDINNIMENDWVLYDSRASIIVEASPHIVTNIDLKPIIEEHKARRASITLVYKEIDDADQEFLGQDVFELDEEGYLEGHHVNDGKKKKAKVSLSIYLINRSMMKEMVDKHPQVDASYGVKELIFFLHDKLGVKIHTHKFVGYARCFDSLENYVKYSFEMLDRDNFDQLFLPERPIYTRTHSTPPTLYGSSSKITNSIISNGCEIDGEVNDCILSRYVKVGKGAKLNHCIIMSRASVGRDATLSNVILDKYALIAPKHGVSGDESKCIYLPQGVKL